jgi:ubiquinone/menaquinone biosynthesis C-methylase UbiE
MCKQELAQQAEGFTCAHCRRTYPVVLGIPDLRVYSDPFISIEEDHFKGRQVQEQADKMDFAALLRFYWEHVSLPPTPVDLRERFIQHVLTDEKRVRRFQDQLGSGQTCLDVGCGAGSLVGVAQREFGLVIGCDVAFRWLILARKRLEELGHAASLVCCCADFLPFPPESFDLVTAVSLLEHVRDVPAVAGECGRVLAKNGRLFVWTANRFSLAPEPHVGIWGLGFLPRRWMPAMVKWRRGLSYEKIHLLSCFDVRRIIRKAGFHSATFSLPPVTDEDLQGRGTLERLGARFFRFLSGVPLLRRLLIPVSPALLLLAKKSRADSPAGPQA